MLARLQDVLAAYDVSLVLLACILGFLTALTNFAVYSRALTTVGRPRVAWLALNAVATGLGVWATNFVAVIAFDTGLDTTYSPWFAALSLLIAIALAGLIGPVALRPSAAQVGLLGGLSIGCGLGLVQITSMLALEVPAEITWNKSLLLTAILSSIVLSGAASRIARASRRWWERTAGAVLLTSAVGSQQFISIAGLELRPIAASLPPDGIPEAQMTLLTVTVAVLLVGAAFGLAVLDGRTQKLARYRLRELADAALEGLVMCEGGIIRDANAGFAELLGMRREQLRNVPFISFVHPDYHESFSHLCSAPRDIELVGMDGTIPVQIAARELVASRDRGRRVFAVQDVRERKRAEDRIRFLAHHDPLTGLPNRVTLNDKLAERLERAKEHGESFALLCLDLDRFKEVNDVFGHANGDAVLIEVGRRMSGILGENDFLARLGGDEFAIIRWGYDQPSGVGALAERLITVMAEEFVVRDHKTSLGVSIGIALFPEHGFHTETLFANADLALYRCKAAGRNAYRFFDAEMDTLVRERRTLSQELGKAIAQGELELHFQPQAKVSPIVVTGFEALLRWQHRERGYVPPGEFIPLAEESGLILELGAWVLRQACAEAARWRKPLDIAVNISPVQFQHGDLPEQVMQILLETGLSPSRLELEITETVLIKDFDRALSILRRLKALGIRIAMDDFGTGYSSLSTLQAFPFDKLKIDRTFIAKLGRQPQADVIVRAVLALGHSLALPVLAEGVETAEQLEFLRREGCDELQGYLLARPAPIETFADIVGHVVVADGRRAAVA